MAVALRARPGRPPRTTAVLGTHRRRAAGLAGLALCLLGCVAASLALGSLEIPLREVVAAFTDFDGSDAHVVVTELRVPRTELGLLAGAALGASGALMQGVTRNPIAEPGILGINSGAAFAVVLAIMLLGVTSVGGYAWFALAGAAVTALLIYALAAPGRDGATPVKLALAGAVLGALLLSLTSAVLVFHTRTLDEFRFWIVGSIAGRDEGVLLAVAPFAAAGLSIALLAGRSLNALSLGDEVARSLGEHVTRARAVGATGAVLLAAAAVAAAGPIAFLGLIVPHVARALVGPDYRWVVPYSAVLGASLLLAADVIGRIVARPGELEVGIVTALLGAPFFIWIVRRRRIAEL